MTASTSDPDAYVSLEERDARQRERNAAGKVRREVLTVLELETAQLRGYLDRPVPNVEGALAHVARLEELVIRLNAR